MGKTSERLEAYQIQMSIYAEQHKMILASDVLDMIEQLQDDLKDDIENVVAELEKRSNEVVSNIFAYEEDDHTGIYNNGLADGYEYSIDIVRKGGAE